jgi:DNA-binding transcriptional ArsR family regulator
VPIKEPLPVGIWHKAQSKTAQGTKIDFFNDLERSRRLAVKRGTSAPDSTLAAIAKHPTRIRIFLILCERTASASEIAADLGEQTSYIANHIRALFEMGAIELVETDTVRNIERKRYRSVERSFVDLAESERLSQGEREGLSAAILRFIVADCALALGTGTFDSRVDRSLLRAPGAVDDQGFRELSQLHVETYERTVEIFAEAGNRIAADPDTAIPVMATTMMYEQATPEKVSQRSTLRER